MTDRPIIFSAQMVRALLAERKSQTRRIYKVPSGSYVEQGGVWAMTDGCAYGDAALPYAPGDRLWVREACRAEELSQPPGERPATKAEREKLGRTRVPVMSELDGADGVRYLADGSWSIIENSPPASDRWIDLFHYRGRGKGGVGNNVPPIHMPRWASRLTLTVTDVRVQRLQDISEADAVAEGCDAVLALTIKRPNGAHPGNPRECYCDLWNSLHGPGAWDANPWVVALTFTVQRGNIDQMPGAK